MLFLMRRFTHLAAGDHVGQQRAPLPTSPPLLLLVSSPPPNARSPLPPPQVYSRVERTGEDFMGHFSANFKVHIIQQSDDEIV